MNNEYDSVLSKTAADLYVSSLILDNSFGGRKLRAILSFLEKDPIFTLFNDPIQIVESDKMGAFGPEERSEIRRVICNERRRSSAYKQAVDCVARGIASANRYDMHYPTALQPLEGMPIVIYSKGNMDLVSARRPPSVAIVGSRRPTPYGVTITRDIVKGLALQNICIISGLARGIDTVAHESTLEVKGNTVAVLAGGLDDVYPKENTALFDRIREDGLLLSEMPPGQKASRRYFPARNRILSGLSDAVAIMEAGEFSGTLHTASFGAAQGKDVFAVPGSIYSPNSVGNHKLIQDGAEILLSSQDILLRLAHTVLINEMADYDYNSRRKQLENTLSSAPETLSDQQITRIIQDELSCKEKSIDELINCTHIPFGRVAFSLSELEISGHVMQRGERYALTFPRI